MKYTQKNCVRSTWTAKVNYGKKSTVKVNPQSKSMLVNGQVNVLFNDDVSRCVADDVTDAVVDDVSR